MPVLFVAAERGMGNDVAFTAVAGRQTGRQTGRRADRQGNNQESTATHIHTHTHTHTHTDTHSGGMMGGKGCACAITHIILLVDANQALFKALAVSQQQQQQHVAAHKTS